MNRLALLTQCLAVVGSSAAVAMADDLQFETSVRPILKARCFLCHGEEDKPKGGLDVRLVKLIAKGGESGSAFTPGKSTTSLLWQRIESGEMPPSGKPLTAKEKATIKDWIDQGAKTARPEPETIAPESHWTDEERSYWAFQPVKRPPLPSVKQADLLRSPIDAFLLSELEQRSLSFSPQADARTLARRLSFDLLGLPPTPEFVEQFANDSSPEAYERLVETVLASPTYGERWARHWLDVAGYADSDGYTENDHVRQWAYRYRDYVIRSLNDDKPYDQFVLEQLAGDELLTPPFKSLTGDDADRLTATGFLRTAPDGTGEGGVDQNVARNDVVAETIKIVSSSLLGVTVGCAQCHDHRYDPISQKDYYRFRAIFEPALDWKNWQAKPARLVNMWSPAEYEAAAKVDAELREVEKNRLAEFDGIVNEVFEKKVEKLSPEQQTLAREARKTAADKRTPEQQQLIKDHPSLNVDRGSVYLYEPQRLNEFNKKWEKTQAHTKAKRPAESFVASLFEPAGHKPATHLFYRGEFNQPREVMTPSDLSVLPLNSAIAEDDPAVPTTGRRLAFARLLTNGKHPLVARVIVNRVWMHHFGRGLVATPGDFGILGEKPSHPALLDWLADEFVRSGWQLKTLHRLIVTSRAYQQRSQVPDSSSAQQLDPDNRLLWRMPVRRLESEAIRDALLSVTGLRNDSLFGPASVVNPDDVGQIIVGQATRDGNGILVAKLEDSPEQTRRSIYVQVRRSMPLGMLEPFDLASVAPNCDRRSSSTVAPQALLMMNNELVLRMSEKFAKRIQAEVGDDAAAQARHAWQLAFGQSPAEAEVASAVELLTSQRTHFEQLATANAAKPATPNAPAALAPAQQSLAILCQALLSSNRFLYVD